MPLLSYKCMIPKFIKLANISTVTQYQLPIKLIIFNNRSLGMVELEMQVAGLPNWQTKMVNPDFAK
nr:thiamine pyrophosphate-dependent enzyme [Legionella sainthelensi]